MEFPVATGGRGLCLAEDRGLHRKVARKFLSVQFTSDVERLARFKPGAQAASALNHPNILTVYKTGLENGVHFIATEFIDGETLRDQLQRLNQRWKSRPKQPLLFHWLTRQE